MLKKLLRSILASETLQINTASRVTHWNMILYDTKSSLKGILHSKYIPDTNAQPLQSVNLVTFFCARGHHCAWTGIEVTSDVSIHVCSWYLSHYYSLVIDFYLLLFIVASYLHFVLSLGTIKTNKKKLESEFHFLFSPINIHVSCHAQSLKIKSSWLSAVRPKERARKIPFIGSYRRAKLRIQRQSILAGILF